MVHYRDHSDLPMEVTTISPQYQVVIPKRVREQFGLSPGLQLRVIAAMQNALVVDLDARLALAAAQLAQTLRLPMAASIILATARLHQARLYTMDADFQGLSDVELIPKQA
jgi:AbrB family looped-hinge helix DNA binding protein